MRNILLFLIRYHFTIIFISLMLISFSLLFQYNRYHQSKFINSSNFFTGFFLDVYSEISEYTNLKEENRALAEENARLRKQNPNSFLITDDKVFHKDEKLYRLQYDYVSAHVINNTTHLKENYITLNKGSKHGIKPDMAVVTSNGIVGIVKDVSYNFSSVYSFLHTEIKISARIKKVDLVGSLSWGGKEQGIANLGDISNRAKIQIGDSIFTSGYSTIFPEGIFIGTIGDYNSSPTDAFYRIYVKLSTDFDRLNYVYVIRNLYKEELDELDKKKESDKANK
ncbi:MAG: rod shape-determining protein MreC [Bacteroidota bacterium]